MWPFKKEKVQDFNDYAETLEMPPCKNKQVHYYWVESSEEKRGCPKCASNIKRRKELDDMNILADLIAIKVIERLKT